MLLFPVKVYPLEIFSRAMPGNISNRLTYTVTGDTFICSDISIYANLHSLKTDYKQSTEAINMKPTPGTQVSAVVAYLFCKAFCWAKVCFTRKIMGFLFEMEEMFYKHWQVITCVAHDILSSDVRHIKRTEYKVQTI